MDIFILFYLAIFSEISHATLTLTKSKENVVEGDNITLMCSSQYPVSEYWVWRIQPYRPIGDLADVFRVNSSCFVEWAVGNTSIYEVTCYNNRYQEVLITNVNRSRHGQQCFCFIPKDNNNNNNNTYSNEVVLYVTVPVSSVETSPHVTSITMKENDVTELSCTSSYARPKPSVTWFLVDRLQINGTGKIVDMQNIVTYDYKIDGYFRESDRLYSARSSVNFTADRSHHGLYLYCNASNYPDIWALSKPIFVNVMYAVEVTVGIKGNEGKDIIIVERNESVQLTCITDAVATNAKLLYKWDTVLVEKTNVASLTYSLDHMTCADAGVYTCVGRNEYSTKRPSVKHLTIFVKCPPQSIDPHKIFMVSLGETVTIRLSVAAYPEPKFTWMKETDFGLVLVNNTPHSVILAQGLQTSLTITAVTKEDYGKYKVLVENEVGQLMQSYSLESVVSDKYYIVSIAAGSTAGALVLVAVVIIIVLRTTGRFVHFGKCLEPDKAKTKRNDQAQDMNEDAGQEYHEVTMSEVGNSAFIEDVPPSDMQTVNTYEALRDDLRNADTEYQDMSLNEAENTI